MCVVCSIYVNVSVVCVVLLLSGVCVCVLKPCVCVSIVGVRVHPPVPSQTGFNWKVVPQL